MRIFVLVLAMASICSPAILHGLYLESSNAFAPGNGSGALSIADDLRECASQAYYASGFRPIVAADFHYGFGGLLAATGDPYDNYFGDSDIIDVIDAAMTLPIMQLAVAEGRK